ncbi:hypothetical protein EK21DRAFT_42315, partial [Setomelanomma holmii]
IRILILQPASDFEAPLRVSFEYHDRVAVQASDSSGYYEAVSYCWGEPVFSHNVSVTKYALCMTANVDSMLRHLRKPTKPKALWIDATCIHQSDETEKAGQVRQMADIYCEAAKVHVWLGSELMGEAEKAFAYLRDLVLLSERGHVNGVSLTKYLHGVGYPAADGNLQSVLTLPWFGRRWILQEIALGHEVTIHCGRLKLAMDWFAKGLAARQKIRIQKGSSSVPLLEALERANRVVTLSSQDRTNLLELLLDHAAAICSDPRDRIFALH